MRLSVWYSFFFLWTNKWQERTQTAMTLQRENLDLFSFSQVGELTIVSSTGFWQLRGLDTPLAPHPIKSIW
uniref:Uncharacterized protein n=1 Tax=Rhizophora mucronata TaxID=61149 RepID=A0A2P2NGL0_RHIMU